MNKQELEEKQLFDAIMNRKPATLDEALSIMFQEHQDQARLWDDMKTKLVEHYYK